MDKKIKGFSLIELILAIGLSSIFLPIILTGLVSSREGKAQQIQRTDAVNLLREAQEAVRTARETGWSSFAVDNTYHPEEVANNWTLVPGAEVTAEGFSREIIISSVNRDETGSIVDIGGSLDPSTKKVTVNISWSTPFPTSISSVSYLTRFLNNLAFIETTYDDFASGTSTDVAITDYDGGEVMLGGGGGGSWCDPNLTISTLDLPKQGVANDISAIEGYIFAGTGENASGESYAKITVSQDDPPVLNLVGTFSNYKTNAIFGEENYGYIATDTNAKEIIILDISAVPYTEIGFFDSPGPQDAISIFVLENSGYMTVDNMLYNFDLSEKTGSRPMIDADGLVLSGIGEKVVVADNYAYVALSGASEQLQIIDISNPSDMTAVGYAQVSGGNGQDIHVNYSATRAYLATSANASLDEFFILNIEEKTGQRPVLGTFDTQGMDPSGVTVVPGNRAIIVGVGGMNYQVLSIVDETNPFRCGWLEVPNGIRGIDTVLEEDGDAFSYIITGDQNEELKIIQGGPGGTLTNEGTYESDTFDPGFEASFNRFDVTADSPQLTNISYQVAISDAPSDDCNLANFTFVGPDGTTDTYFTESSNIPMDDDDIGFENPGRCFRYKVYFTTQEITLTSILYDITINYSP